MKLTKRIRRALLGHSPDNVRSKVVGCNFVALSLVCFGLSIGCFMVCHLIWPQTISETVKEGLNHFQLALFPLGFIALSWEYLLRRNRAEEAREFICSAVLEEFKDNKELMKSGIRRVHRKFPLETICSEIESAQKRVRICVLWFRDFDAIAQSLHRAHEGENKCMVQIFMARDEVDTLQMRSKDLGYTDEYGSSRVIGVMTSLLRLFKKGEFNIVTEDQNDVRSAKMQCTESGVWMHEALPSVTIFEIDRRAFIGFHFHSTHATDAVHLEIEEVVRDEAGKEKDSEFGKLVNSEFEKLHQISDRVFLPHIPNPIKQADRPRLHGVVSCHKKLRDDLFIEYLDGVTQVRLLQNWIPEHANWVDKIICAADAENGCLVEILLMHPNSKFLKVRSHIIEGKEDDGGKMNTDFLDRLIQGCANRVKAKTSISVGLFNTLPSIQVYQRDHTAFVGYYLHDGHAPDNTQFEIHGPDSPIWNAMKITPDVIVWNRIQSQMDWIVRRTHIDNFWYGDLSALANKRNDWAFDTNNELPTLV